MRSKLRKVQYVYSYIQKTRLKKGTSWRSTGLQSSCLACSSSSRPQPSQNRTYSDGTGTQLTKPFFFSFSAIKIITWFRPIRNYWQGQFRPIRNCWPRQSRPIRNNWPRQFRPIRNYWPRQFRPIRNYWPRRSRPITSSYFLLNILTASTLQMTLC